MVDNLSIANEAYKLKNSKILIAEDLAANRTYIKEILNSAGYKNLIFASNGHETVEKSQKENPDLILLDLIMPKLDGYQACLSLKSNQLTKNIPIIIQSSSNSTKEREEAFKAGASDFVNKPIDTIEMLARIKIQLSQYRMFKRLLEFQERINLELEEARNMLFSIIPKNTKHIDISKKYNLSIASFYKTSQELGGDYYGIKEIEENIIASYIWDFSGHGISSAINTFRLHTLIQGMKDIRAKPADFLTKINKHLCNLLRIEQYATMFYAVIDLKSQKIRYVGAASPDPYLISFSKRKIKRINATGFPLGITTNPNYQDSVIDFEEWDTLLLYSDALTETYDKQNSFFDLNTFLENLIKNSKNFPSSGKSNWLLDKIIEVFNKSYFSNLKDDLTINIISK